MSALLAREGAPTIVDGVAIYNACCVWCDEIASGPFADLTAAGWTPTFAPHWNCPDHAPSVALPSSWSLPASWDYVDWTSVQAATDPFPGRVRDRTHWDAETFTGLAA